MSRTSPLRGALIGCGFVSQFHLEAWKTVPDARLVALCDLDPERLDRAVRIIPGKPYRDASLLFRQERLDFVELCTRPETHRALVELAARHGVHVLCQKPAAVVRSDLQAMIDSCARAAVRLMIHENWRFRPWYRALKRELDAGTIGRPIRLRLAHRDTRALRPDGFRDQPYFATMPRLILLEMGCHLVDTARYLLGEIETVTATLGRFGPGHAGEDLATLSVGFASGALGLLDMTWCAPADVARPEWALNETCVEGTEGLLKIQTDGSLLRVNIDGTTERTDVPLGPDDRVYIDGYAKTQAHFIDGIVSDSDHETSGTDNLKTMDVVWAGYTSAEEGRTIRLGFAPDIASPGR
jgi:predicted dehydrogenase